jgi:SAM-dependent methyltransferase
MGTPRATVADSDSTLKQYLAQETDLPSVVRDCISREGANLDLTIGQYFGQGCRLPRETWAWLNREGAFSHPLLSKFVAPFPPKDLMENVSGPISERGFASHGADFWLALSELVDQPLTNFGSVLDYGCGCGRLGRMFKGHPGKLYGCDVNGQHIDWVRQNIPYYSTHLTKPDAPLPYPVAKFDLIISISVFTHISEDSQDRLLRELFRVSHPGTVLLLTIHGERAMERVINEPKIWEMISVDKKLFEESKSRFERGEYGFILQWDQYPWCDPTSDHFPYGVSFIPRSYISSHWGKWFHIEKQMSGALHDWQDVIVMRPRKTPT